jgi:hypothetical protein
MGVASSLAGLSRRVALLGCALWRCTLTQEDFEPILTEAGSLEPGVGAASEMPPMSSEGPLPIAQRQCTAASDSPRD